MTSAFVASHAERVAGKTSVSVGSARCRIGLQRSYSICSRTAKAILTISVSRRKPLPVNYYLFVYPFTAAKVIGVAIAIACRDKARDLGPILAYRPVHDPQTPHCSKHAMDLTFQFVVFDSFCFTAHSHTRKAA